MMEQSLCHKKVVKWDAPPLLLCPAGETILSSDQCVQAPTRSAPVTRMIFVLLCQFRGGGTKSRMARGHVWLL